jgi:endonuclease/exonuclease/phosphatase family metal-dependent hydrolase
MRRMRRVSAISAAAVLLCSVWFTSIRNVSAQTGTVVLWASKGVITGNEWEKVPDSSAAGGILIRSIENGQSKRLASAIDTPSSHFEMTFNAVAGVNYHIWVRGRAVSDLWTNDSIWVQFSGSMNTAGAPAYRIGTESGIEVNLEECGSCGVSGWGWEDNGWHPSTPNVLGPDIRFETTGLQTLRIQVREDGFSIDQIVLQTAPSARPGAQKNDNTILSETDDGGTTPAGNDIIIHAADLSPSDPVWLKVQDSTAASGQALHNPNLGVPKLAGATSNPAHYIEAEFMAEAGRDYHLWVRGRAENNSYANDSFFVQFSGTVSLADGTTPRYRIGTTESMTVSIEEGSDLGLNEWGWADNEYLWGTEDGFGEHIRFAQTGLQTIRIQQREDGVYIDQIIVSSQNWLTQPPGSAKDDSTIVPKPGGTTPPESTTFGVITWNVRKCRGTDNDKTSCNRVAQVIHDSGAGVALLSAVETLDQANQIRDRLNVLAGSNVWDRHWHAESGEGQAILARGYTMLDKASFPALQSQCNLSEESQAIVKAKVVINGHPVYFFAIDQQHGSEQIDHDARACQAAIFKGYADNFMDAPRIVAGDFNADPGTIGSEAWRIQNETLKDEQDQPLPLDRYFDTWLKVLPQHKMGYSNANAGVTAGHGNGPGDETFGRTKTNRIDYIMYRGAPSITLTPESARMVKTMIAQTTCANLVSRDNNDAFINKNATCFHPCGTCAYVEDTGVRASDHVPYLVTFRIH